MSSVALAEQLEQELSCRLAFVCHDLRSDEQIAHRADEPVPTASVIKLPILVHIALAVAEGRLGWEAPLSLDDAVKVPGTGVLKELSAGLKLSVRDLCVLMTALSDNTATNMLIDLVGIAAVNERLAALGLTQTRLLRRAFDPDPSPNLFGLGVTTARDTADLLARVVRRQLSDAATAAGIEAMLAMQQDRAAIPRLLPKGWRYAGKTGSNPDLRADAAILAGPEGQQLVVVAFCAELTRVDWSVDNPGLLAIACLARALALRGADGAL